MGVPKFFRYMSERYPCLSELIKEYQIPEFDNLYLDMNGIIHNCSHPDDNNPHFRITEERIFKDIFHYIEVLFRMIKPRKIFFMAIDGVAPRAKMNQQRGRRFRTAKEMKKTESDALEKGEVLPTEARFDSNCITPGTQFMAKLQEQLKYFVVNKISTDKLWRKCKVILSGHETPGEGEHKIMDYIRYMRSRPEYNPNTRHCLYGLDADLIMLGLCTHDPHFSLLREEVKFGRKTTAKRTTLPENINFFLLHLSLMREYLELEFSELKEKLTTFPFDIESIIDDWVLMGFLVGNDFIPNLPNLQIVHGSLPVLYKAYMDILPTLGGYINESGFLNLQRFEQFMIKLSEVEQEKFAEAQEDLQYMQSKTGRKAPFSKNKSHKFNDIEDLSHIHLVPETKKRDKDLQALIDETEDMASDIDEKVTFESLKTWYYVGKLEYKEVTPEVLQSQAECYVRAIQWNLHYYYNGVCSWSWFYPHHYAPYISDIRGFSDLKLEYDLGTPFKPFEQLLAVLPSASKIHLPECYHKLMVDDDSPIKQYYPEEFETDLNGKQMEWEAVVLIPIIDEEVLLRAMEPCNKNLTPEEVKRNTHGPMRIYTYNENNGGTYESPAYFPKVACNNTELVLQWIDEIKVPVEKLVKGAYPGSSRDLYYPGFPTMKHLKYEGMLKKAKVKVFEQPSRNESMVISILKEKESNQIPVDLLGKVVHVQWPHLVEAKVVCISNSKETYVSMGEMGQYNLKPTGTAFQMEIDGVTERYLNRLGIDVGKTKVLVKVQLMIGKRYIFTPNNEVIFESMFCKETSNFPLQTIVPELKCFTPETKTFEGYEEVFPAGSLCFTLTNPFYGAHGTVKPYQEVAPGRVKICLYAYQEPDLSAVKAHQEKMDRKYKVPQVVATSLTMSSYVVSRVTGSVFVTYNKSGVIANCNIGLDLKFNKKNMEVPGYTKKVNNFWLYSERAVNLISEYANKFPEVFQYLSRNNASDNIMVEEIFHDLWSEKFKELQDWLKNHPYRNVERRSCGSSLLDVDVICELENVIENYKLPACQIVTMQIKPTLLFKPGLISGNVLPDAKADIQLFDRVVNIREGFDVPIGLKGTVVGLHVADEGSTAESYQFFDVMFDTEFIGGIPLHCSTNRGYKMPKYSLISISYGQRLIASKSGNNGFQQLMQSTMGNWKPNPGYSAAQNRNDFMPQFQAASSQPFPNSNAMQPHPNSAFYNYGNNSSGFNHSAPTNAPIPGMMPGQFEPNANLAMQGSFNDQRTFDNRQDARYQSYASVRQTDRSNERAQEASKENVSKVDTDLLKLMLGIQNNNEKDVSQKTHPQPKASANANSTEKIAMGVNPALELLNYFQSKNLGLPRYQYSMFNNKVQAQVSLPNRQVVIGRPGATREEASDLAAFKALQVLKSKVPLKEAADLLACGSIPEPPKKWVNSKNDSVDKKNSNNVTSGNAVNNFIPLQALKHANKTDKNKKSSKNGNASAESCETDENKTSTSSKQTVLTSDKTEAKPRRPRRMRIAANFNLKE